MVSEMKNDDADACFSFEDMRALRDEYEQRIRVLEQGHEAKLKENGSSRQELIEDLTIELAAAREDGERRAQEAEQRRLRAESALFRVSDDVARLEAEIARLKQSIRNALAQPSDPYDMRGDVVLAAPAPATRPAVEVATDAVVESVSLPPVQLVPASPPPALHTPTVHTATVHTAVTTPPAAVPRVDALARAKKKKIRLR
jgi:hypothetical protein